MNNRPTKPFFRHDTYQTPTNSRTIADRLFVGSRWWFYHLFSLMVFKSGKLARNSGLRRVKNYTRKGMVTFGFLGF
jgi:hypothetical protein